MAAFLSNLGMGLRQAVAGPSRLSRLAITSAWVAAPDTSRSLSTSAALLKLKSHSGAKKRFTSNSTGLFKRSKAGKQHLNTGFSAGRINRLGLSVYVNPTQAKRLRRLLPYA